MVRLFVFLAAVQLVLLVLGLISSLSAVRVRNMPRFLWVLAIRSAAGTPGPARRTTTRTSCAR
jgi:hypothetical protein